MSSSGEESKISLGAFADATGQDKEKRNKAVELALQHHNDAAANSAMQIAFFNIPVGQLQPSNLKDVLYDIGDALQQGHHASNSHQGRFLRDHLVKEHVIKGGMGNAAKLSFIDRLLGKKAEDASQQ